MDKGIVYQLCLDFIKQRIQTAETALAQAREASNDDTKSSAGDKYETSREMMQQDIDRNKRLLMDAQENMKTLEAIGQATASDTVSGGSLVYTDEGIFYISISAGQLHAGGKTVFAISAASPIGKLMLGKKKGDDFSFNGKKYLLNEVL
ncbi:transcription elongation GreA/GreB family factor [Pedobacter sp. AK017]|uniref:3-oxoacyl-ACP synthase n=1 Tax=Pedobacter sp. AK017 TaxID=2723073 RepID=UPI001619244C|nr:3-oxoacyl-ACP synthase [Pedobacter sp. AK017]MBB5436823.1 transcription elongation GreA/GreB family factor [Pedobacter sp. AK017]